MKRLVPILGFIALLGLSSCVERQEISPNFNPETKQVNTQFFLNIEAEKSVKTKQLYHDVQADTSFNGLSSATLFAFTLGKDTLYLNADTIRTHTADAMFNLSDALHKDSVSRERSRRIIELSMPMGTNSLIFYGKATRGDTEEDDEKYGKLNYIMPNDGRTSNLWQIGCYAAPRIDTLSSAGKTKRANFQRMERIILDFVNHIDSVGFNGNTNAGSEDGPWNTLNQFDDIASFTEITGKRLMWKDYAMACNSDGTAGKTPIYKYLYNKPDTTVAASPLEHILGKSYKSFSTINSGELRAGSGASIARQLSDLYNVLVAGASSAALDDQERVAQEVIIILKDYINSFINPVTQTWRDASGSQNPIKTSYLLYIHNPAPDWPVNYTFSDFPRNFHLPFGATTLKLSSDGINWTYNSEDIQLPAMGDGTMTVYDYTYPPELTYYGNGPVWINNSTLNIDEMPNTSSTWEDRSQWSGWAKGHVESSTRGVALVDNVQYGVSMLETKVYCDGTLKDNNSVIHPGENDNVFSVGGDKYLKLTGVLIGGQPAFVGWDYTYYLNDTYLYNTFEVHNNFKRMIYDWKIQKPIITTSAPADTANCYTLVFDNWAPDNQGTGNKDEVYVSLEFENHLGNDFWGMHNMVREGGTFYLIGCLRINNSTGATDKTLSTGIDWSQASPICPYKNVSRVFVQDFITQATFQVTQDALKKAYVTVPDLRTAKLSFGLSVNLVWSGGNAFVVDL